LDNKPSLIKLFLAFFRLGLTAFGGPAMIAYIKELAVNRKQWLDEAAFKNGVALCQMIPGATAMQTAAYVGYRANGIPGALTSFIGFGLPAFIFMLALSALYSSYHIVPWVIALFSGLQVAVVAIVANATYTFGKSTLKNITGIVMALGASVCFGAGISPFIVIIAAAVAGILLYMNKDGISDTTYAGEPVKSILIRILVLLFVPFFMLFALYFIDLKIFDLSALMMKIDLFAFGGGFASLPLMLHEIVDMRGWLDHKTFMDGIALGQVTPGPIVITATFVGYMIQGPIGALAATIAIFMPSFLMLVATVPLFDRLKSSHFFLGATKGILASFVGLLFFVTIKFAFAVPWDIFRFLLVTAVFLALIKKVDILYIVLVVAIISVLIF
jgi:chromate transporter